MSGDEFSDDHGDLQCLEKDLRQTQSKVYAAGTLKNLACQWRSFRHFSIRYNKFEWPVPPPTTCVSSPNFWLILFIQLKLCNYIDRVRKVHVLFRVEPPSLADIEVRITLMGLNKTMLSPVRQVQSLMPEMMLDMVEYLDLTKRVDLVFWGVVVVGFFTFFCKSNLIPDSKTDFDPAKQLLWSAVKFDDTLAILTITWSKTIQYRQRAVEIPLFPIENSPLCLVTVVKALMACKGRSRHLLFSLRGGTPFTYPAFQKKLRATLGRAGYEKSLFSSHSLRWGTTLWAFKSGVPERLIQVQGDWTSDAYKRYLSYPIQVRAVVNLKMRKSIQERVLHM